MRRESGRAHLHGKAEIVKPCDEPLGELGLVTAVEMIAAEVVVDGLAAEDVIGRREYGCGDCDDGLLRPPSGLEAQELSAEVRVVFAHRRPGGLDQSCFEPGITGEGSRRASLAGALVLPGRESNPRAQ